ncbi:hypothetical protein AVEN_257750-1 [Araneus ventricosus]|uniref:Uncharacterized protein n=1 Tax=Araneus ventricosus TaxID=182803 RepID=A0A4Y2TWQ2_ARAVE|nr:hypothetical protein AVEN_193507-1 [Araneus ventricosus]GBO04134.1 hypothetical protein AVEN_257750-1 [Araneus ventricosus]
MCLLMIFFHLILKLKPKETLTELDILDSVKNKNNTAMNCGEDEDDEDGLELELEFVFMGFEATMAIIPYFQLDAVLIVPEKPEQVVS